MSVSDQDSKDMVNYWAKRWESSETQWHIEGINPTFVKHLEKLTGDDKTKPKRFILPLCGKTKDIPFLYSLGHEVFGIEAVEKVILDLGIENDLKFSFDPQASIYHTDDGRVKIYFGDMFKCPIEKFGPFDCVWDRGSFIAIGYEYREAYIEALKKGLKDPESGKYYDFQYLLQTVSYDKSAFSGPPHCVDDDDMAKYFGDWSQWKVIEKIKIHQDHPMRKVTVDLGDNSQEIFYIISPK